MNKKNTRAGLLFCVGLIVATAIFELYLQLVEVSPAWKLLPAAEISFYGPDPDAGYNIRPNVQGLWLSENRAKILSSSQGLRDHETSFEPSSGTERIAIAGDSITEGLQVSIDETFSEILEKQLSTDNRKTEVINLGISGASPAVQVARMKSLGVKFSPDLMIFVINVGDFGSTIVAEDSEFAGYVDSGNGTYGLGTTFRNNPSYLFRTSLHGQFFYYAMDNVRLIRILNTRKNRGILNHSNVSSISSSSSCDGTRLSPILAALRSDVLEQEPQVLRTKKILQAFKEDLRLLSVKGRSNVLVALRGVSPQCENENAISAKLASEMRSFMAKMNVSLIDMDGAVDDVLHESFPKAERADLYGFGARLGEGHLNQFGHKVVAMALFKKLGSVTRLN